MRLSFCRCCADLSFADHFWVTNSPRKDELIGSQKGALEKGALAHLFWFKNEPFFVNIGCIAAARQSFRLISNGVALVTYLRMQYSWVFYLLPCAIWRRSLFVLTATSMFILKMTCWGWYLPCLAKGNATSRLEERARVVRQEGYISQSLRCLVWARTTPL